MEVIILWNKTDKQTNNQIDFRNKYRLSTKLIKHKKKKIIIYEDDNDGDGDDDDDGTIQRTMERKQWINYESILRPNE